MDLDELNPIILARCTRGLPMSFERFSQTCRAFMSDLIALHRSFVGLSFVRAGDPQRQPALLPLLGAVVKHWPVRYASYGLRGWNPGFDRAGPEEDWTGCMEIGWHTDVDESRVAEILPADVTVQRVGTGILLSLFDEMPDANAPATVERARAVRARLAEAGWLKRPLA